MAMLATLEGNENKISLEDLFNVNDYLGVKYFGPEDWNRVKKCACIITAKAANNPVLFYIDSLKNDYPDYKESELSKCVFGFNDRAGSELMGSIPWNRLKVTLDNELLGFSIGGVVSKIGSGIKTAAGVAKTVATAPIKAGEYIINQTPLKYTPGAKWYNLTKGVKEKYVDTPAKDAAQSAVDVSSGAIYKVATKTPLKYTGIGQIAKYAEKLRESAGVTSPGTAEVYETQEEINAKKRAAAEAAAKAASKSSAVTTANRDAEKKLRAEAEQKAAAEAAAAQAQAEQAATAEELTTAQANLTSKYAPIVMVGMFGLLALSILKNK